MTEEFPADTPPPNPAPDPSDDLASESEVDALLADAAELAAEVSEELDEVQPEIDGQDSLEPAALVDLTPEAGDVDAQLATLDALIEQASQEIGRQESDEESPSHDRASQDDPAPTAGSTSQPITVSGDATAVATAPDDPSAASLTSEAAEKDVQPAIADIPDFMKEFTEPSDEETSSNSPPSSASEGTAEAPSEPDRDLQTVEQEILATGRTRNLAREDASSNKPATTPATTASPANGKTRRSRKITLHVPPKLAQVALSVCDRGATALELIDRPTSRIGDQFRMLAGLAAVATLATALIVFVISLF